jgi:branched-chain amino acid transport system permease protein
MWAYVVGGAILGSIYVMFALGLSLVWGVAKVLNLAHGAIFMAGALGAYLVTSAHRLPLIAVLPIGMVVSAALSVAVDQLAFRQIRRRVSNDRDAELAMLLASIGASAVIVGVAARITHLEVKSLQGVFDVHTYQVGGGATISNLQIIIVALALGFTGLTALLVRYTQPGRALRAVAYDRVAATMLGVGSEWLIAITTAIGGALAGAAGVLYVLNTNALLPDIGDSLLIKAFAIIILGGVGSIMGTLVGGFALAAAETVTVWAGQGGWRDAIAFGLILVILILRPGGIFAQKQSVRA